MTLVFNCRLPIPLASVPSNVSSPVGPSIDGADTSEHVQLLCTGVGDPKGALKLIRFAFRRHQATVLFTTVCEYQILISYTPFFLRVKLFNNKILFKILIKQFKF